LQYNKWNFIYFYFFEFLFLFKEPTGVIKEHGSTGREERRVGVENFGRNKGVGFRRVVGGERLPQAS
jgi:hypothetical protein